MTSENKNIIPIAFAFGSDWMMPACVCISSLLASAEPDTFYDIFILHSPDDKLDRDRLSIVANHYGNCEIHYREVDHVFDSSYEVRGIKTMTYYRLLIPELIPEYEKILYSDVDVVFRNDLSHFYAIDLGDNYVAGVDSLTEYDEPIKKYLLSSNREITGNIYAGNIILNSKKMREDGLVDKFREMAGEKLRFQDMDILNIVCRGKIKYIEPAYCVTTYFMQYSVHYPERLTDHWNKSEITSALEHGIIHYNGQKPWKAYCVNFDIWWEAYRKSPVFDEKYYFDFFYSRLNELDMLPLWKRVKILLRYFIFGKKSL